MCAKILVPSDKNPKLFRWNCSARRTREEKKKKLNGQVSCGSAPRVLDNSDPHLGKYTSGVSTDTSRLCGSLLDEMSELRVPHFGSPGSGSFLANYSFGLNVPPNLRLFRSPLRPTGKTWCFRLRPRRGSILRLVPTVLEGLGGEWQFTIFESHVWLPDYPRLELHETDIIICGGLIPV